MIVVVLHTRLAILPIMQRLLDIGHEMNEVGGIVAGGIGREERERGHTRLSSSTSRGRQEGEGHCQELHPGGDSWQWMDE